MIHQFIFAGPKPGMSVADFQQYWLSVHAVRYASKIPQIRRYLVDTTLRLDGDAGDAAPGLPWRGVAEIWLRNDEEQLASLQTPEFLDGARLDEPKWAAFWQTLVLDTQQAAQFGDPLAAEPSVKRLTLVKRAPGMSLQAFREQSTGEFVDLVRELPGIRSYEQCHVRDGAYAIGEAPLDAVHQMWFADPDALADAIRSDQWARVAKALGVLVEPRYVHALTVQEHWIVGPEERA